MYVTPERLVRDEVTRKLLNDLYQNEMLARIVIDEAHCVSSWGHDFRKDYGALGEYLTFCMKTNANSCGTGSYT